MHTAINPNIVIQLFKMMNICYAMFAIMCMQIKCHLIRDLQGYILILHLSLITI